MCDINHIDKKYDWSANSGLLDGRRAAILTCSKLPRLTRLARLPGAVCYFTGGFRWRVKG